MSDPHIINDVTGLNPVQVWAVATPTTVEEVQDAIRRTSAPISIGGGRFSMGGQIAHAGSLHLDMRRLNKVVWFSPLHRTIRVQAGTRWCDIQRFIDPHELSVKIMQTYANFTVGGSVSVNCHGRYMGLGPVILSVRAISLVLANGERVEASPAQNAEFFWGAIGCYGALGVIVEVELELAPNVKVEQSSVRLHTRDYLAWFRANVRSSRSVVFHNADMYPPHYQRLRAISWTQTDRPVTVPYRLLPIRKAYPLERYFFWAWSETPLGKWRREWLIEPLLFLRSRVHWRNYEASYDVAELEPASRVHTTYVLQEYFVPIERFEEFHARMTEVLVRHRVNVINISVRHALADPGSLLAWARHESFAFVLWYKQRTRENAKNRVAVWTRELVEAAIQTGGGYYLPYQVHARPDQFHRAYPRADELFALKRRHDPEYRFRHVLWEHYYQPTLEPAQPPPVPSPSEFHRVFEDVLTHDGFYLFLQNIYRLYPEDRFHALIKEGCATFRTDEEIYRFLQERLPGIKPFLAELTYALPALRKQKQELTRQTLELLGDKRLIHGYVEMGTVGRYVSEMRAHVTFEGPLVLLAEEIPTNSPPDVMERGQLAPLGRHVPLRGYQPIDPREIADGSIDVFTCYVGLHHAPLDLLDGFVRSIHRVLRPGGLFILRDHDVRTPAMFTFVSLVHTVFNAGLNVPWETNQKELKLFRSVDEWSRYLAERGFRDAGRRIAQAQDPTDNLLMAFVKVEA